MAVSELTDSHGEERFRLLVESVRDYAIFILDPTGRVETWNAGAERLKGYAASEIIGKHFSVFYTAEDLAAGKPERELEVAQATGKYEEEGWRVRKDGTLFWANVVLTPLREHGKLVGFAKVTRDLTERKRSEEELRRSEQRFRLMVQSVQDYAIFFLDLDGRITSWNEGAQRIKGYTPDEIIGKTFHVFYPPDQIAAGHPEFELDIVRRVGKYEEEGWRVRKDGSQFWAQVLITAIRDEHGELTGFVKVTRDVTERRLAQQALERAAAELEHRVEERTRELAAVNKELEAFGYSVSHDLRAPLRALDGFSKRVLDSAGAKLDDTERDYLHRVRAAAQRMSQLIDDMLDLSRLVRVPLSPQRIDLTELVNSVVDELRSADSTREVEVAVDAGMHAIADRRLVRIALVNLISNAWKFTRKRSHARIEVGCEQRDGRVVYRVRDNGVGFDLAYATKLFLPFQRMHSSREFEGTGIGLATVQRIVRRHGGDIWVESAPDAGASFYFTLEPEHEADPARGGQPR